MATDPTSVPQAFSASPASASGAAAAPEQAVAPLPHIADSKSFYILDAVACSPVEAVRSNPILMAPVVLLLYFFAKLFRSNIPGVCQDPNVRSLDEFELSEQDFVANASTGLKAEVEKLRAEGFVPVLWHRIEDPTLASITCLVGMVHAASGGKTLARVHEQVTAGMFPPKNQVYVEFLSRGAQGRFLWTTSGKFDANSPPECRVVRKVKAKPADLWRLHQTELDTAAIGAIDRVTDAASARALLNAHQALVRDFHVARGCFREPRPAEASKLRIVDAAHQMFADLPFNQRVVYAEMNNQASARTGWGAFFLIAIVSLVLFVTARDKAWGDATTFAIIVAVLLFHELGHYVAMKIFGYRDLKMFFIPTFGAAVSGKPMTATGWKRAIVSLAGPLPGIALGIALGIAAAINGNPTLKLAAFMLVGLNAFNLLPFPPLDGGHIVQITLASRHFVADLFFRSLGLFFLIGMAAIGGGNTALFAVCGAIAVGMVAAYKLGSITHALRHLALDTPVEGRTGELSPVAPGASAPQVLPVPPRLAREIIPRVIASVGIQTNRKAVATNAMHVYQTLHARPPGVLGTLAILGVHGAAVFVAIVFGITAIALQSKMLQQAMNVGLATADYVAFEPKQIITRRGGDLPAQPQPPRATLIAHFETEKNARSHFDKIDTALPSSAEVMLLPRSVLLSIPEGDDQLRKHWTDEFTKAHKDSLVSTAEAPASFSMTFIAPNEEVAARIEDELSLHLGTPGSVLIIPPWAPSDTRTAEERRSHDLGRKTIREINKVNQQIWSDPRLKASLEPLRDATRRQDKAEMQKINKDRQALTQQIRAEYMTELRNKPDIIAGVVDAHEQFIAQPASAPLDEIQMSKDWRKRQQQYFTKVASFCGPASASDGKLSPEADAVAASSGFASRTGLIVTLTLSLHQPVRGLDAVFHWLEGQRCGGFRYQPMSYPGYAGGDEDSE